MKRTFIYLHLIFLMIVCISSSAHGFGVMLSGFGNTSSQAWADWSEISEDTLSFDQNNDGVDDTYVVFFENKNTGGGETGQGGGVTGVNLDLTQSGVIAGAKGSTLYRELDANNDMFTMTTSAIDALIGNTNGTWTIILKCADISCANDYFWAFQEAGSNERVFTYADANSKLITYSKQDNNEESNTTTNIIQAATTYYICQWADGGSNPIRGGFTTTKPTKWSDFGSNDRNENATNTGNYVNETFNGVRRVFASPSGNYVGAKAYYLLISNVCLIDNNS